MSNSIYKDFAGLLFELYSKNIELSKVNKGAALAGTLEVMRINNLSSPFGILGEVTYESNGLVLKDINGNKLESYEYNQIPDPVNKDQFVDFLSRIF